MIRKLAWQIKRRLTCLLRGHVELLIVPPLPIDNVAYHCTRCGAVRYIWRHL